MIRTQILIEENQINWLIDRAREKGVSVSQLIREGVEFYRKYKDRLPEDQKKRALAAIGRYASGVSDISEKHDDYLTKAFKAEDYVKHDYYNGINAAFMYTLKANLVDNEFDAIVCYGRAKMIRQKVVEICLDLVDQEGFEKRGDCEWVYQTLAQAYLGREKEDRVREILPKIEAFSKGTFDMTTFRDQNQKLIKAMEAFKRRYPAAGKLTTSAETPEESTSAQSTADTATGPKKPEVSHQPGGPISINLGSHQDKPVKSIEVTCKVEFT